MSLPTRVFGLRYSSAVGITCIIYDHFLTFEDERQAIWINPNANLLSKFGFFANRYGSELLGLYVVSVLSGIRELDDSSCVDFVWMFSILASVFVTLSHFAVIFRIYHLWDRRTMVGYMLGITFFLAICGMTATSVVAVVQLEPYVLYLPLLRSCIFAIKPQAFPATLGIISLYDFFLIVLTIYNALHKPRRDDIEMVKSLQNDSAVAFLLLFVLRLVNLIVSLSEDVVGAFVLLPIVWLFCAVVNARLQIRLESLSLPKPRTPIVFLPEYSATRVDVILLPEDNHSSFWFDS